ncbi:MAG: CoA transferase, partial [Actinomycetota bacterium]|nr:CoA transferase [Actinomycetota bacterium]
LLPILEDIIIQRDAREWLDVLQAAGVPAARVNRMPDVFKDPNVAARGMIQSFSTDDGIMRAVGNAIKIAGRPETEAAPPPRLGGDTESILRLLLGYEAPRIAQLEREGVFGDTLATSPQARP